MQVTEIDPHDDVAFDAWFAVLQATDAERWPDKPGWQRAERLAMALDDEGPEEHRLLVAWDAGGIVCGIADVELYRRENAQLARTEVRVLPNSRRRGIGSSLLTAVEQLVAAAGRTELGGMDETPVRRELRLPLSRRHARALADSPKSRPPGYSLITFADRWPDELIEDRCELGRRMSTDVPMMTTRGGWPGSPRSPFRVAPRSRSGNTTPSSCRSTAGTGFAMKVANLVALERRFAAARWVSTCNAAENAPMIAVNDEMGFEVVARSNYWLKKLE